MKAHVFWGDQMWTHIYVERSIVTENAHRVLTVDTFMFEIKGGHTCTCMYR